MLDCSESPAILQSGPLRLDRRERKLWRDGQHVALAGLPLRILEMLMLAEGRLVTRTEIKAALWPYAVRIDTERRLNTAMRALREALGDTAQGSGHIETVRGAGYRWIAGGPQRGRTPARRPLVFAAVATAAITFATWWAVATPGPDPRGVHALEDTRVRAWQLVNSGRADAARPQLASLIAAGATDPADAAELGWLLLRAGKPEAAIAVCSGSRAVSLNLLSCRQTAFARLGVIGSARTTALEIMRLAAADPRAIDAVADAPSALGYMRFLRWRVENFVPPTGQWFQRAQLQAEAGLYREALASLRRAVASRDPLLVKIGSSIEFAPLRSSPEFRQIQEALART